MRCTDTEMKATERKRERPRQNKENRQTWKGDSCKEMKETD